MPDDERSVTRPRTRSTQTVCPGGRRLVRTPRLYTSLRDFQLHLMMHWSRWLAGEGADLSTLSTTEMERFLKARRRAGYT